MDDVNLHQRLVLIKEHRDATSFGAILCMSAVVNRPACVDAPIQPMNRCQVCHQHILWVYLSFSLLGSEVFSWPSGGSNLHVRAEGAIKPSSIQHVMHQNPQIEVPHKGCNWSGFEVDGFFTMLECNANPDLKVGRCGNQVRLDRIWIWGGAMSTADPMIDAAVKSDWIRYGLDWIQDRIWGGLVLSNVI